MTTAQLVAPRVLAQDAADKKDSVESARENYQEVLAALQQIATMPLSGGDRDTLTKELIPAASRPDMTMAQLRAYMDRVDGEFWPVAQQVNDSITAITDSLDRLGGGGADRGDLRDRPQHQRGGGELGRHGAGVDSVAQAARSSSESIAQAEQAAGELSELSTRLGGLVAGFRV